MARQQLQGNNSDTPILHKQAIKVTADIFMSTNLKMSKESLQHVNVEEIWDTKNPSSNVINTRVSNINQMHILNGHLKHINNDITHLGQYVPDELLDYYLGLQTLGYSVRKDSNNTVNTKI